MTDKPGRSGLSGFCVFMEIMECVILLRRGRPVWAGWIPAGVLSIRSPCADLFHVPLAAAVKENDFVCNSEAGLYPEYFRHRRDFVGAVGFFLS